MLRLGGLRSDLRRFWDDGTDEDVEFVFGSTSNRFHLGFALTRLAPSSIALGTFLTSLSFVAFVSGTGLLALTVSSAAGDALTSDTDSATTGVSFGGCLSACGGASEFSDFGFELVAGFLLSLSLKSPVDVAFDISFLLLVEMVVASEPNVGQSDESASLLFLHEKKNVEHEARKEEHKHVITIRVDHGQGSPVPPQLSHRA